MSKASQNANAVVSAVIQVCELYGVRTLRQQSRVMSVPGAAGRERPMFFGQWKDRFGTIHYRGMPDILARPRFNGRHALFAPAGIFEIDADKLEGGAHFINQLSLMMVTVPLWIECKSGKGELSFEQEAFRADAEANGEYWLHIHDDVRPLIEWFEKYEVKRR